MARDTARRSSASSPSVELTNTRSRLSGVRMTASSRGPGLTDRTDQAPPRKSATSHSGQQAPHTYPTPQPARTAAAGQVLNAQLPATVTSRELKRRLQPSVRDS